MTTGRRNMLQRFGGIFRFVILILALSAVPRVDAGQVPDGGLPVGSTAPDFRTNAVNGDEFGLKDIASKRKLVLLSFWGLRCGECIDEIPSLNEARKTWGEKGLEVVGVNADGIDADILRKQIRTLPNRPEYVLIVDPDLKIADAYKLKAAPLTVGISPEMEVVFVHSGFKEGDAKILADVLSKALSTTGQAKGPGK